MRSERRLAACFAAAVTGAAMALGAAGGAPGCGTLAPPLPETTSGHGTTSGVRFVGRVEPDGAGGARYAWSGAGIVARFRGTGAVVLLRDEGNHHQVVLDGLPRMPLVTRAGVERYVVAEDLPPGEHRLEVYRRTEALFGVTRFLGIEVTGGGLLDAGPGPGRRLEVVGDSITCGYGAEGAAPDCRFSAGTENHYVSYGAVLARALGAELSTVAWSGRGVVRNYAGEPGEVMGLLYERTLPASPASRWTQAASHDAVIVNLGTNDFSTEPDPAEGAFVHAYVELLKRVRGANPHAFVLCTIGPMLGGDDLRRAEAAIAVAVARRRSAGDERVAAHRMTTSNESPGCDWHPGVATHRRIAEELAIPLRAALGW